MATQQFIRWMLDVDIEIKESSFSVQVICMLNQLKHIKVLIEEDTKRRKEKMDRSITPKNIGCLTKVFVQLCGFDM